LIGYNRWIARHGYIVVWNDNGQRRVCRVVGRVAYAPEVGSKEMGTYSPMMSNYLMLIVLNTVGSSTYIRWVHPDEIVECYDPKDYVNKIRTNLERFLSDEFIKKSPLEIAEELGA
jgi:hypothetical protein